MKLVILYSGRGGKTSLVIIILHAYHDVNCYCKPYTLVDVIVIEVTVVEVVCWSWLLFLCFGLVSLFFCLHKPETKIWKIHLVNFDLSCCGVSLPPWRNNLVQYNGNVSFAWKHRIFKIYLQDMVDDFQSADKATSHE